MILRLGCALIIALSAGPLGAQDPTPVMHVWKVAWKDVTNSNGTTARVPVLILGQKPPDHVFVQAPDEVAAVIRVEERLRIARVERDGAQLAHLVSEDFYGTDSDGNRIDRQQMLGMVASSTIRAVDSGPADYRVAAGAVIVSGEQTITTSSGQQRTQFTRVYSRDPRDQEWRLISTAETRPRS
jgi:hypothetical protein